MTFILCTTTRNAKKSHFKKIKSFVSALLRNPYAKVQFLFTARCANGSESIGNETTSITPVICVLLISATFRTELDHCALESRA